MSVATARSAATRRALPAVAAALQGLRGFRILVPFAVLVAIWWAIKASGDFPDNVLVSPLQAWQAFVHLTTHGVLAEYASTSLTVIGIAALISMLLGVPIGFAVGTNRYAAHALEGFLRFLQSISGIAWLPLAIIWFGFSHTTTLVIVIYSLIVPIIFNTMIGVRAIPENYAMALRSLGAGRFRLVTDVYLPGALPSIVVGLRLGMGYGWRALIAAEMLVGAHGLGFMIFSAQNFHLTARIMLGMAVIGALWLVLDYFVLRPLEQATIARWGLVQR